jgi:hypothetical protein
MQANQGGMMTMTLLSMPNDMLEVIFATFTLLQLARASGTCPTFRAFYRSRLAAEQKTRKELAINFFGVEQLTRLIDFIVTVLKGASLDADMGIVDNKLNPLWCGYPRNGLRYERPARSQPYKTNEIRLEIYPHHSVDFIDLVFVRVGHGRSIGGWSDVRLRFRRNRTGVGIWVLPKSDNDFEGVGLVHAILDGGLAQYIRDAGKWVEVKIWGVLGGYNGPTDISRAGMKAQSAHFLPASSHCVSRHNDYTEFEYFVEVLYIGQE